MANKSLPVDWRAIRSLVENTGDYEQASKTFGVAPGTLRQRAKREGWLSPGKVTELLKKAEARNSNATSQSLVANAIAESWAEKGENLRQLAYTKALNSLKTANLKPASNARDFEILDKVARRAAGLDTADNQVNLSFSLPGWGPGTKCYDVDSGAYSGPSSEEESSESPTAIEDRGDS